MELTQVLPTISWRSACAGYGRGVELGLCRTQSASAFAPSPAPHSAAARAARMSGKSG